MRGFNYGRNDLAMFVVNGNYSDMTTHAIAAKLLAGRADTAVYRMAEPEGGPILDSYAIHYEDLLSALTRLAEIGGERLVVDGASVQFVPNL
jgi:hypothetical protein